MGARDFTIVGFAQNANPAPTPAPVSNQGVAEMAMPISTSRSQAQLVVSLSITDKKEEDDGTWKATFTATITKMDSGVKVPVPAWDVVFKVDNDEQLKARESTDSEGSAEVEIKGIPAGKHNITAMAEGTVFKKVLKSQAFGEDGSGGKDVADIEVKGNDKPVTETSTVVTYNLLLTPVNAKGKGVKSTLGILGWNWTADDKAKKFDGKLAVRVNGVTVTENTVLDVFVEGSAVSKKVFLDGPYKPSGNKALVSAVLAWVLAFALLMSAAITTIGSVVGIGGDTSNKESYRRRSDLSQTSSASSASTSTSTTWVWWTASGLMFATALTFTGFAAVKKGEVVAWEVKKKLADRKLEAKEAKTGGDGKTSLGQKTVEHTVFGFLNEAFFQILGKILPGSIGEMFKRF